MYLDEDRSSVRLVLRRDCKQQSLKIAMQLCLTYDGVSPRSLSLLVPTALKPFKGRESSLNV